MIWISLLIMLITLLVCIIIKSIVGLIIKKETLKSCFNMKLLFNSVSYIIVCTILLLTINFVFKKINQFSLIWLSLAIYLFISFLNPYDIYLKIKNKEKIQLFRKNKLISYSFLLAVLLEIFAFNSFAYPNNKNEFTYSSFINESINSNGLIEDNKITLKNKQYLIIDVNDNSYDNLYLHFDNDDMNLYLNIYTLKEGEKNYKYQTYYLIDPSIDQFGYIPLTKLNNYSSIKIEFDIDSSRYLNNQTKPFIFIDKISFDAYFPFSFNPLRIGILLLFILLAFNFKKIIINPILKEDLSYNKIEKIILLGTLMVFIIFIIQSLINNTAYFIKYDELYLGGTSSSNIYYQQFDAYIKGQLYLDVPVDPKLIALANPYGDRSGVTFLWDHAFYNGKYYSYYGHAPIYLVMLPIYFISGYVPSNLFILQLGVLFSISFYLLTAIYLFKLFVKKTNMFSIVLVLISMVVGSLLLANNTYEYGGMIYRIPYAYGNLFLFLTIYLFLKGYTRQDKKLIYYPFASLSLVFIVLSRPLLILVLIVLLPILFNSVKNDFLNKKILINYLPSLIIIILGVAFVCTLNYLRFDNILEFGEHYQLTVTDCRNNALSIEGILPTIFHYFVKYPKFDVVNNIFGYNYIKTDIDIHPYISSSIGLMYIPITLFIFALPFVIKKEDSFSYKYLLISSPIIIFFLAYFSYCFAGVCPRYLLDFSPLASLISGLVALKIIEKNKIKAINIITYGLLLINIYFSIQYHFKEFDGLRIGDFNGLFGIIRTVFNQYN